MKSVLKRFYYFAIHPIHLLNIFRKRFFYFILPNLSFIIQKRLLFSAIPVCNQRVFFSGSGRIEVGVKCIFGYKLGGYHFGGSIEIQPRFDNSFIKIGNNVATNNNIFVCAANYIEIGDDTLIGQNVTIMDFEAHGISSTERRRIGKIGQVIIGKNVWIGNNVTILKNTTIGDNTIVATGAVVIGTFPANVIIGGVPAKVIKNVDD